MSGELGFEELLFTLSNEDRLTILRHLEQEEHRLTEIAKHIDSTPQETSRNLNRLKETLLVERTPEGAYRMTPYGSHLIHFMPAFRFLHSYRGYFRNHTLRDIPNRLLSRVGELAGSAFTDDVMYSFHNVTQMIEHAEKYVWIMSDQVLMSTVQPLHQAIQRGVKFRLIVPRGIQPPGEFLTHVASEAWRSDLIELRIRDRCSYIVTMSEKSAFVSFPSTEGNLDYLGFRVQTEQGNSWCRDLFLESWRESHEKPDFFITLNDQLD